MIFIENLCNKNHRDVNDYRYYGVLHSNFNLQLSEYVPNFYWRFNIGLENEIKSLILKFNIPPNFYQAEVELFVLRVLGAEFSFLKHDYVVSGRLMKPENLSKINFFNLRKP